MTTPKRVQMSRQHPWRADNPDAVIVTRPGPYGNPYTIHQHTDKCDAMHYDCPAWPVDDRAGAVRSYRHAVLWPVIGQPKVPTPDEIRRDLAGHDLACWCSLPEPGQPDVCHAAFQLELANAPEGEAN